MVREVSEVMRWQIFKTASKTEGRLPSMQDFVDSRLQTSCQERLSHREAFAVSCCNDMPSSYAEISTTS